MTANLQKNQRPFWEIIQTNTKIFRQFFLLRAVEMPGLEHWNCGAVHVQLESHVVRSYNVQNRRNSRRTMYTIHLCRMSGVLLIGGSGSGGCSCRDRCCRRDYSFVPEGPLTNQSKL